jgi:rubredoxin-NAD+ reductase
LVLHGLPQQDGQWEISHKSDNSMVMQQRVGNEVVATLNIGQPLQSRAA